MSKASDPVVTDFCFNFVRVHEIVRILFHVLRASKCRPPVYTTAPCRANPSHVLP